jgi:signal transduction histidine kinase
MGVMTLRSALLPRSMEAQMMAILALSLLALFATLMVLEVRERDSVIDTAGSSLTFERLHSLYPMVERIGQQELPAFLELVASCHAGYELADAPFSRGAPSAETERLKLRLARELSVPPARINVGRAQLTRSDFSYDECRPSEIDLPMDGIVIGVQLSSGRWFNAEVHPHESHWREKLDWMLRASVAFVFVGGIAIFFMRRLSKPLNSLTSAARRFGEGLQVSTLQEDGPSDLRRAIRSFNEMQQRVAGEVERRTNTLAAISHDVRTPLTALRVKAELVDDPAIREDLIASINRMEKITASALEFLRGQSRGEPMRSVDLSALLESECTDFEEVGRNATFIGQHHVHHACRPDALARAVRNLIDNAIKYGGAAKVELRPQPEFVDIVVSDTGPGIPQDKVALAVEPFERLSQARESNDGGFGLGLAVAKAVAEGHDGELILAANEPTGLVATIRLPA